MSSPTSTLQFHSNGGTYPPHGIITPNNHGPYVVVTTWIFMCMMSLALLARLITRQSKLGADKIVITIAAILSIAQNVTVNIAVDYGLGQHRAQISESNFLIYSKAKYASQLLALPTLILTKLSLLIVFSALTLSKPFLRFLYIFVATLLLWFLAGTFALAFQCKRPRPWDFSGAGRCGNQDVIYYANAVVDILTDAVLSILPVFIMWKVQIARRKKGAICGVFALRGLAIISTIIQTHALETYFASVDDRTWHDVTPTIWAQISLSLSLITALIPLIAPFFQQLQFGLIDASVPVMARWWMKENGKGKGKVDSKTESSGVLWSVEEGEGGSRGSGLGHGQGIRGLRGVF